MATATTQATERARRDASGPAGASPSELSGLVYELSREFGAPVGLLDPAGPAWAVRLGAPAAAFPDAPAAAAAMPVASGCRRVVVARLGPEAGPTWLGLPAPRPGGPDLVAWAGFAPGPGPSEGPWGPPCPRRALRAWGQSVADRLRAGAAAKAAPDVEAGRSPRHGRPLPERLVRLLRVNDPPERFQRLATSALREALAAGSVAWVPASSREPVVSSGSIEGLPPESFRALVPPPPDGSSRVEGRSTGPRPGAVRHVAVVAADPEATAGWLVAVNPAEDRPFSADEVGLIPPVASLIGVQRSNARSYGDLKELLFGVIRALTSAIDAKDPYTSGHSERVARIAVRLGEALGLPPHRLGDLYLMGLLHDVGKIGVEDGVLKKPGRLTPDEFRSIQSHVRIGVHILSDLKKLHHLLPGVAHHHESLDGSGYPSGLSGDSIPLPARILAVADAFDAMSSTRPYRRRLPPREIDAIFLKGSGVQWDPRVVDALFSCRPDLDRIRSKGLGESLQRAVGDALDRT